MPRSAYHACIHTNTWCGAVGLWGPCHVHSTRVPPTCLVGSAQTKWSWCRCPSQGVLCASSAHATLRISCLYTYKHMVWGGVGSGFAAWHGDALRPGLQRLGVKDFAPRSHLPPSPPPRSSTPTSGSCRAYNVSILDWSGVGCWRRGPVPRRHTLCLAHSR